MTTMTARHVPHAEPGARVFARALGVWLLILIAAFANGALREVVLAPVLGEPMAAALSAIILCAVIVLTAWWLVLLTHPHQPMRYWWLVGLLWVALTAGFELGFFHYLMGEPLAALLAAYDPRYGCFGFVQLTTLLAPPALARLGRGRASRALAPQ